MIRIRHVSLPPGLTALARRGPGEDLRVYVSDSLPPQRQRAAVRVAVRAARGRGWHAVPLPLGMAGMLPAVSRGRAVARGGLRRAGHTLRGYAVVWGTAAAVMAAAVAAVCVAVVPPGAVARPIAAPPAGMNVQRPGLALAPGHARHAGPAHRLGAAHAPGTSSGRSGAAHGHGGTGTVTAGRGWGPAHTSSSAPGTPASPTAPHSTAPSVSPHPSPSPSPSQSPPPSPSPTPSGSTGPHCVINALGIRVCLG